MNFLVKGVGTDGKTLTQQIDNTTRAAIYANLEDYGLVCIKSLREIRSNTIRREGRSDKRNY